MLKVSDIEEKRKKIKEDIEFMATKGKDFPFSAERIEHLKFLDEAYVKEYAKALERDGEENEKRQIVMEC